MKTNWETAELLRQSRHDWLNQIQIIKANLSLNRVDRANEVIEEITDQSHHEAKLTNLNIPEVAGMLLTFNWDEHPYRLKVEVVGRERDLSHCERNLIVCLTELFRNLDSASDMIEENRVLITFLLNGEETFLTVDFSGKLNVLESLDEGFPLHQFFSVIQRDVNEKKIVLTVQLP